MEHVVSRCSRKGKNMWGCSPLSTLLLFSIFTAVHSEEKQDVGKGAIVRARLEVCSGLHAFSRSYESLLWFLYLVSSRYTHQIGIRTRFFWF